MRECTVAASMNGLTVRLSYPEALDEEIWPFFSAFEGCNGAEAAIHLRLEPAPAGEYRLSQSGVPLWQELTWPAALQIVLNEVQRKFAAQLPQPVLQAAAVGRGLAAVLMIGPNGCGKSALASWFCENGCRFLTDGVAGIADAGTHIIPLPMALMPHAGASTTVLTWPTFADTYAVIHRHGAIICREATPEDLAPRRCRLVIVPQRRLGARLQLGVLTREKLRLYLDLGTHPEQRPSTAREEVLDRLCEETLGLTLGFGDFSQLDEIYDQLIQYAFDPNLSEAGLRQFVRDVSSRPSGSSPVKTPEARSWEVYTPAFHGRPKRLTVAMATHDDYDGVYFTLQSLRMYHPEVSNEIDYMVIDNNPSGPCGEALRKLARSAGAFRYVPGGGLAGTATRELIAREAAADFVMSIDCDVMIEPGAVGRLIAYCRQNPGLHDLLQGPMLFDDLARPSTHWEEKWQGCVWGDWGYDEAGFDPDNEPFDIRMHTLSLFAFRREAWPGGNPHFRGSGGEEGYLHHKFRLAGGRTLCLPFLRWTRRFQRPLGASCSQAWQDRIRNYMLGFDEVGLPMEAMLAHVRETLGDIADPLILRTSQEIAHLRADGVNGGRTGLGKAPRWAASSIARDLPR